MRPNSAIVRTFVLVALLLASCGHARVDPEGTIEVPGGPFWTGSDLDERAHALDELRATTLVEAADALDRLEREPTPHEVTLAAFRIMRLPVTNAEYHRFVLATGAPEPWIDRARWDAADTGFAYAAVERHAWVDGEPPRARERQPVVLVDHALAQAYCAWWGEQQRGRGALPTELQWEKAAHDPEQHWGDVFEWTRTRATEGAVVVKGGSWSRGRRVAARHARPAGLRHVAIGFRCVLVAPNAAN